MSIRTALQALTVGVVLVGGAAPSEAAIFQFMANLSGPAEEPPNNSPGTGTASLLFDNVLNSMTLNVSFSGLLGTTTAAHIHCCTPTPLMGVAGVATPLPSFPGFPLGVMSGTYLRTFDLSSPTTFNPAFPGPNGGTPMQAEAQLLSGLLSGRAYLNIHTTEFPGGEIRGFFTVVPGPIAGAGLPALLGLAGLVWVRRRKEAAVA
jgi:LPXTG-motif cell wall-anchored protein